MDIIDVYRKAVSVIAAEPARFPNTTVMFAYKSGQQVVAVYSSDPVENLQLGPALSWTMARLVKVVDDEVEIDTTGSKHSLIFDPELNHWELV